ncbi:MAG TPA: hypothetical protein DD624_01765 [Alphaproteobacteria bacterium]|nr:hypothetical protein [Alphaproteobacteria bacterium]
MSNRLYYLKVFFIQHRAAFAAGIVALMLAAGVVWYAGRPKIPVTEQDFADALQEGEALFAAKRYEEAYNTLIYPARHGYPKAQYLLGELYYNGWGTNRDAKLAFENYSQAAETLTEARYKTARMAFRGEIKSLPKGRATALLTETAYHGCLPAQRDLGLYSLMSKDWEQAYFWLSLAAKSNDEKAAKGVEIAKTHLSDYQLSLLDAEVKDFLVRK